MNAMKGFSRAVTCSVAVLGLAACTGTPHKSASTYVAPPRASSYADADEAYMARVEGIARRRGVEVVWVNVPRKPASQRAD